MRRCVYWSWMRKRLKLRRPSEPVFLYLSCSFVIPLDCRFWRQHNDQLLLSEHQTAQLASLRAAYAADVATLEKLERTNVYNDAFCIGHDGVFGTINGLRLGRVPGVPVSGTLIDEHQIRSIALARLNGQRSTPLGAKHYYYCIPLPESWTIHFQSTLTID